MKFIGPTMSFCKYAISSSGYCPPELVYVDEYDNARIKTYSISNSSNEPITAGLPYDLVTACAAHDAWSLGATLYYLFTGSTLLHCDSDDNLDNAELLTLYRRTDEWMAERLKKLDDPVAKNLLSQLLSFDPKKRPSMRQVLAHPFISGGKTGRLPGEEAEFGKETYLVRHIS